MITWFFSTSMLLEIFYLLSKLHFFSILAYNLWHNSLTCRHKRIIYSLVRPIMDVTDVDNIFFFAKVWSRAWKKIFYCQQDGSIILRTKLTKWWWPFQTVENKCHIICQALWCVSLVNCRVLKDFHSLNHLEWIRGFDSFNSYLIQVIRLRIMNVSTKIFFSQNRVVKSSIAIPDSESVHIQNSHKENYSILWCWCSMVKKCLFCWLRGRSFLSMKNWLFLSSIILQLIESFQYVFLYSM